MKTIGYSLTALLLSLSLFFGCTEKPCIGEKTFDIKSWGTTRALSKVTSTYPCREIVFTYSDSSDQVWVKGMKNYLDSLGFVLIETCPCTEHLELWRIPAENPQSSDLQGVITGGKDKPDGVGGDGDGLTFNFDVSLDPILSSPPVAGPQGPQIANPNIPPVLVAIIDSGVDPANEYLTSFLWNSPSPGQGCKDRVATYGFNIEDPSRAPIDSLGHGTMVNGIVAGIVQNPSNNMGIPLQLINVKFTKGKSKSGSLFDAVCGSYYAMQQGAKVLNMSWGFKDSVAPKMMIPLLEDAKIQNVVVVTAMGNDSASLDGALKFWPAAFAAYPFDVVSVGAGSTSGLALFSNRGNESLMTLTAPGIGIISTYLTGSSPIKPLSIGENSGTSFSAPFVSRTAAIMVGMKSNAKTSDIKDHLTSTATNVNSNNIAGAPFRVLNHNGATTNW